MSPTNIVTYLSCVIFVSGLKQVLIAGIYLLSVISVPSTLSAPTKQRLAMSNRYDSTPKWINPANLKMPNCSETNSAVQLTDAELIEPILLQTTTAHRKAVVFRTELVSWSYNNFTKLNYYNTKFVK